MIDGAGDTTYTYDQLSRLTSEARTFTGLTGAFSITYGYNLANQLISLDADVFDRIARHGCTHPIDWN